MKAEFIRKLYSVWCNNIVPGIVRTLSARKALREERSIFITRQLGNQNKLENRNRNIKYCARQIAYIPHYVLTKKTRNLVVKYVTQIFLLLYNFNLQIYYPHVSAVRPTLRVFYREGVLPPRSESLSYGWVFSLLILLLHFTSAI